MRIIPVLLTLCLLGACNSGDSSSDDVGEVVEGIGEGVEEATEGFRRPMDDNRDLNEGSSPNGQSNGSE